MVHVHAARLLYVHVPALVWSLLKSRRSHTSCCHAWHKGFCSSPRTRSPSAISVDVLVAFRWSCWMSWISCLQCLHQLKDMLLGVCLALLGMCHWLHLAEKRQLKGSFQTSKFLVVKCMDSGYSCIPGQITNPEVVESCSMKRSMLDKSSVQTPASTTLKNAWKE